MTISLKRGGGVITGTSLGKTDNTSSITVCGGTDNSKGGSITIYGKDKTNNNGEFSLVANDGTSSSELWGKPNGTLTWRNKDIDTIEEQGDGYIRYSNGLQICWGSLSVAIGTSLQYDPPSGMYYGRVYPFNYAKGFSSIPVVSLCVFTGNGHPFLQVCVESSADNIDRKLTTGSIMLSCKLAVTIRHETSIHIQAIGRWK